MPRNKELEQLPMANIAPSIGQDRGKFKRSELQSLVSDEEPKANTRNENK